MILEKETSLGLLPLAIVAVFMCGIIAILIMGIIVISIRNPVAFVQSASRPGAATPFQCTDQEAKAVAQAFLTTYTNWTDRSYAFRMAVAASFGTPGLDQMIRQTVNSRGPVIEGTAKTSSANLEKIDVVIGPPNSGLWQAFCLNREVTTFAGIPSEKPLFVKYVITMVESRPDKGKAALLQVGQVSIIEDEESKQYNLQASRIVRSYSSNAVTYSEIDPSPFNPKISVSGAGSDAKTKFWDVPTK